MRPGRIGSVLSRILGLAGANDLMTFDRGLVPLFDFGADAAVFSFRSV